MRKLFQSIAFVKAEADNEVSLLTGFVHLILNVNQCNLFESTICCVDFICVGVWMLIIFKRSNARMIR